MSACPRCGRAGRAVEPATVEAQVLPPRADELSSTSGWYFCAGPACQAVYFRAEEEVLVGETRARPFSKSSAPDRRICFCFEHNLAELEMDLAEHGQSTIRAAIKAACGAGEADCQRQNPQGRCCLGDVGWALKNAAAEAAVRAGLDRDEPSPDHAAGSPEAAGGPPSATEDEACCCGVAAGDPERPRDAGCDAAAAAEPPNASSGRSGLVATGGALLAAVLSSACCWLPLGAIALGASSAGLGAFFEAWRVPFLLATGLLLGLGFYLVYRRPRCAPGEVCARPNPRLQRTHRGLLWLSTVMVLAFAAFPEAAAAWSARGQVHGAAASAGAHHYRIEGMTCAGCVEHAREAIAAIPQVRSVEVSYDEGRAAVVWRGEPRHAAVAKAVEDFGYRVEPLP